MATMYSLDFLTRCLQHTNTKCQYFSQFLVQESVEFCFFYSTESRWHLMQAGMKNTDGQGIVLCSSKCSMGGVNVYSSGTFHFLWNRVSHCPRDDQLAKLAREWVQAIFKSLLPQHWFYKCVPPYLAILHELWGWSSGPLTHKVNILSNESSPNPRFLFLTEQIRASKI